tara:strand:+ start:12034 stop:12390 length:357 start_codon:yes stop_codon:yes gene_type:complete
MKEQVIEFETAKLAKEKGFPTLEYGYEYNKEGQVVDPTFSKGGYSIPTQSLLHRWLMEIHGYYVIVIPTITSNWTFKIINVLKKNTMEIPPYTDVSGEDFPNFQQALEKGLKEALKLI